MKKVFKKYMSKDYKFNIKDLISILLLTFVISGIFGWIYEVIFYFFNSGMTTWYMRGANYLPFINIYATGSIMIFILTYKFRNKPWLVFLISLVSTGILEYCTGFVMDKYFGLHCWDYNNEILSFGSISGYVCIRSVTVFGLCGLLLMYGIIPLLIWLNEKNRKVFRVVSIIVFSIFLFDELYNLIFARILDTPRATDIYKDLGLKYMKYK